MTAFRLWLEHLDHIPDSIVMGLIILIILVLTDWHEERRKWRRW